jgi:hypothetical protein
MAIERENDPSEVGRLAGRFAALAGNLAEIGPIYRSLADSRRTPGIFALNWLAFNVLRWLCVSGSLPVFASLEQSQIAI